MKSAVSLFFKKTTEFLLKVPKVSASRQSILGLGTAQGLKMSYFGELPDVVLPKIAQKRQSNSQDLVIFVKSTSGSNEIRNFQFFGIFEQFRQIFTTVIFGVFEKFEQNHIW